ncbi:MAG: S41 family peptidase [Burkholderiales bacterium]
MRNKFGQFGLIIAGVVIGIAISLNFSAVAQRESAARAVLPLPIEELRAFTEVFDRVKRDYVEPVEDKKLITEAINGMLTGLDPHSAYLDQEAFREMQVGTQGQFGGLGIEVGMEDGFVKVISPIDDTPASRAGVLAGDLIVKLDDASVKGMTLNDAVKQMRGKPDTNIRLTIVRKGEPNPIELTLTRAVIKIQSVKSTLLEPGYAYFRVTQFQDGTGELLARAIETHFKANSSAMRGVILDLRNDPGGLLNSAVAVSAMFLEPGQLVVYTDGRAEDSKMRLNASPEHYLRGRNREDFVRRLPPEIRKVPMVVLVNGGSASASEIVAGALQDHNRAVIMGQQTFGKGSVQTILPLGNSTAIKLTTARYYTPQGRSIQAKGITPDIPLEGPVDKAASLRLREADLSKHLTETKADAKPDVKDQDKEKTAAAMRAKFNFTPEARPIMDPKELRPLPGEVVSKNDYELHQAVAFLKSRRTVASN